LHVEEKAVRNARGIAITEESGIEGRLDSSYGCFLRLL